MANGVEGFFFFFFENSQEVGHHIMFKNTCTELEYKKKQLHIQLI